MESLISEEYEKIANNALTSSGKCNIISNIVQIKLSEPSLTNIKQDLSIDIKDYLNSLIEKAESASIGYDSINVHKVNETLSQLPFDRKIFFINYLIRQLQKSAFEHEIRHFQKLKTSTILWNLFSKNEFYKPKTWWLISLYFPVYNIVTFCFTFIIISILIAIVLLPSPYSFMGWLHFDITYQQLSNNFFLNHLLNIFSSLVGIESEFKIQSKDLFSASIHVIGRIITFIYVVNYLFNKLSEYLKN